MAAIELGAFFDALVHVAAREVFHTLFKQQLPFPISGQIEEICEFIKEMGFKQHRPEIFAIMTSKGVNPVEAMMYDQEFLANPVVLDSLFKDYVVLQHNLILELGKFTPPQPAQPQPQSSVKEAKIKK